MDESCGVADRRCGVGMGDKSDTMLKVHLASQVGFGELNDKTIKGLMYLIKIVSMTLFSYSLSYFVRQVEYLIYGSQQWKS